MAKKKTAKKSAADPSFEESLASLETIVSELEGGDLPLETALDRYEQAVAHLKRCHQTLSDAEGRIRLLSGVDKDGNAVLKPFDDPAADTLEAKSAGRARRRSAGGSGPSGVDDGESLF